MAILLKNLWPGNPPAASLILEVSLNILGFFGPLLASLIVLKKRSFKAILSFIISGRKGTWLYFLIFSGGLTMTFVLASGGRLMDGALVTFPSYFTFSTILGGGIEEFGWRGFLQPAMEKKFSFPLATLMTGIIWACRHIPLWFYDRFQDRSQDPFLLFIITTIILAIWLAGLRKRTQSVLACNFFHALFNTLAVTVIGIIQAIGTLNFSQINPFFFLGGLAILTLYSIYLWYWTDKEENIFKKNRKES
ncbi:CAAX amino terminal protease family protein [Streptococcus sp. DD11]|nr:CAAX amino terminal protease family protein [Streptococcus sp. DD11]